MTNRFSTRGGWRLGSVVLSLAACGAPSPHGSAAGDSSQPVPGAAEPAPLVPPAPGAPASGEFEVASRGAGYEVRTRDATGMASTVQCDGTCFEICSCVGAACASAQPNQSCDAAEAACIEGCNGSSCTLGDPRCFFWNLAPVSSTPSDPSTPGQPPGGAGPDPSPVD